MKVQDSKRSYALKSSKKLLSRTSQRQILVIIKSKLKYVTDYGGHIQEELSYHKEKN